MLRCFVRRFLRRCLARARAAVSRVFESTAAALKISRPRRRLLLRDRRSDEKAAHSDATRCGTSRIGLGAARSLTKGRPAAVASQTDWLDSRAHVRPVKSGFPRVCRRIRRPRGRALLPWRAAARKRRLFLRPVNRPRDCQRRHYHGGPWRRCSIYSKRPKNTPSRLAEPPRHSRTSLTARQFPPAIDAAFYRPNSPSYQLQPSFHPQSTEPEPTARARRAGKEFY